MHSQSVVRRALPGGSAVRALALALLPSLAAPAIARAQSAAPAPSADSALARAQRLVGAGQGAEGRQVIDSLLGVTPPDSPRYAEVLFARASLSATAAQAERDYRRIFVEFPVSRRAPEALMRLAQLEMARGDRALARGHLERLTREHAGSPMVPRAHYWLARVRFDQGEVARGCEALAAARAAAGPRDVELRNQVDFYAPRCPALAAARDSAAVAVGTAARRDSLGAAAPARGGPPTGSVAPPRPGAVTDTPPDVTVHRSPAPSDSTTPAPPPSAPPSASPSAHPSAPESVPPAAPRAAGAGFTVQVAAYDHRPPAERLAAKLAGRGLAARVVGAAAPFRVRIGRYATHAEAASAAARLRAERIEGFVVASEGR